MIIEYDKEIEVSEEQYILILKIFSGIIAHRQENGKYFIKVLRMQYAGHIEKILKNKKSVTKEDSES